MHFTALFALSIASSAYAALGPIADVHVANKVISPDGYSRSSVLVNGVFPAPLITNFKGGQFLLNVIDSLTDPTMLRSTSIHWHGFFQKNTSYADGPAFVTQCPIAANHSFLYDFSTGQQAGTYWYHSHLSTQYCDGLRGPLVVYDLADPQQHLYDIDDESTVITLADWYHYPAPSHPAVPVFNSTLINGLGRYPGGPLSPLAIVNVNHGKKYRFRLVSISCDPNWIFSIDNHQLTVIEADGVATQPHTVDSIQIFAGQRYSFVLQANQPVANYWIRAQPNLGNTTFINNINSGIFRYAGAPNSDPVSTFTPSNLLLETDLHPLVPVAVPDPVDLGLTLNIGLDLNTFHFTINGVSFVNPTAPVLLQILSGATAPGDLLPAGSIYALPPNKNIEINIPGGAPGAPHPFHLHGHNFHVVRSAGNATVNLINPVIRDVVSTGPSTSDNVTFRFRTDNAGPWFLHCHIDWHLDIGLAVVLAEDTKTLSKEKVPQTWKNLCPIYDGLSPSQL